MGTSAAKSQKMGFFKPGLSPALGDDKLEHLKHELKGSLFPMHTKLFVERIGVEGDFVKAIIGDEVNSVKTKSATMTRDDLKELLLLAAFMGANQVFKEIKESQGFTLDEDIVNTALLSGRLDPDVIKGLVHDFHAGYGSIRFAIKSDKIQIVDDLMGENDHLHFGDEHLTQAVAQGNTDIFDRIMESGVMPKGKLIHSLAKNYPEIQTRLEAFKVASGEPIAGSSGPMP